MHCNNSMHTLVRETEVLDKHFHTHHLSRTRNRNVTSPVMFSIGSDRFVRCGRLSQSCPRSPEPQGQILGVQANPRECKYGGGCRDA